MDSLNKLNSILVGWKNYIFPNKRIEKIAKQRAAICAKCKHNVDNRCNLCGCFLVAKLRSPYEHCKINKW